LSSTSTSLASFGVPAERDPLRRRPSLSAHRRPILKPGELASQLGDPIPGTLLGEGDIGIPARSASATSLAIAERDILPNPGKLVGETGELDLEHRLTCARAPFEDPKDDGGPIENLCSSGLLEAALLAGRKLVIDHHEPDGTGARCRTAGYRNP
jgi:hypothetical protein